VSRFKVKFRKLVPISDRFRELRDKMRDYGSPDKIPESVLKELDYVRVSVEGLTQLVPVEQQDSLVDTKEKPIIRTLPEKYEKGLGFEQIIFYTPKNNIIEPTANRKFILSKLESLNDARYGDVFGYVDAKREAFADTALDSLEGTVDEWLLSTACGFFTHAHKKFTVNEDIKYPYNPESDNHVLSQQEATMLLEMLDAYKASAGDPDHYRKLLVGLWIGFEPHYNFLNSKGLADFYDEPEDDLSRESIYISSDFIGALKEYLISKELKDIADKWPQQEITVPEALVYLKNMLANSQAISDLKNSLTDLIKQQKNKGLIQEERNILSTEISKIKENLKLKKRQVQCIIDYFSLPEIMAKYYKSKVSEIQKNLVPRQSSGAMQITIDGTYDKDKDTDPGTFCDDCTAGKPLPFAETNLPVYNLKVYAENVHIGNIYLVEAGDGQKRIWHLDAIQIRSRLIDWDVFPETLANALGEAAEQQGVAYITINNSRFLVSNYDYVGDAFLKYCDTDDRTPIIYPENPDPNKYSSFQGNDNGRVLWQNKKTKEES
jgi:hypothetical protein